MTEKHFATVGGKRATTLRVVIPPMGVWFADVDLPEAAALSGAVTVQVGNLTLHGTVAPAASGSFALATRTRIVGGAGGWASSVVPQHYHNDAGVKAATVAADAARAVGEALGTFVVPAARLGVDYVRRSGPASQVLEDVLGGTPWWVDFAGKTNAGPREPKEVTAAYELLGYDPRARVAQLGVDDPTAIGIGSVLRTRLDTPQTVRELELVVTGGSVRLSAWCGGGASSEARIAGALRAIVRAETSRHELHGLFRYRVVRMAGDRVELQAVRKRAGLPDALPISMWPGMAGLRADLTPGALVLVTFIEGDPTAPVVTHFEGKDGPGGWKPLHLVLDATSEIDLGCEPGAGAHAARQGDSVVAGPFGGTITGGSAKVRCG